LCASADDLEGTWEALKAAEKGRTSVTEGVPLGQPALSLAHKLQKRAAKLGAPVPPADGLGGELWDLVARCRQAGLDPEVELRAVARAFRDRLAAVEADVRAAGREPADLTPEEWAQRWT
jgi:XTP/dITP diphosphohydrolase